MPDSPDAEVDPALSHYLEFVLTQPHISTSVGRPGIVATFLDEAVIDVPVSLDVDLREAEFPCLALCEQTRRCK
jgi:hypothetical protein